MIKVGQRWIFKGNKSNLILQSPHIFTVVDVDEKGEIGTGNQITVKPYLSDVVQHRTSSTISKEFELMSNQGTVETKNENIFKSAKDLFKDLTKENIADLKKEMDKWNLKTE